MMYARFFYTRDKQELNSSIDTKTGAVLPAGSGFGDLISVCGHDVVDFDGLIHSIGSLRFGWFRFARHFLRGELDPSPSLINGIRPFPFRLCPDSLFANLPVGQRLYRLQ